MLPRERSFWGALALVAYVCAAHLRVAPDAASAWACLLAGPVALVLGWRLASPPTFGVDWIDPVARRAARGVATGVALALVAEFAPPSSGFMAARTLGLGAASVGSAIALGRIAALGGASNDVRHRYDAVVTTAAVWLVALGLAVVRAASSDRVGEAVATDVAIVTASLASIGIGLVGAWRVFSARRFELGVPERAAGALGLGVVCLGIGALAALTEVAAPERVIPLACVAASSAFAACAVSQQPALVARVLRLSASVTLVASPVMSMAVVVAYKAPTHAGAVVFAATAAAVLVGMAAPRLAERIAPERGRWMRVFEQATVAAKAPDPRQAVALSLAAIRDGLGADEGPAALYRFETADRWVVDRAGYLHTEPGEVPLALVTHAERQAERIVSTEVLRSLEVRQGDVRAWLRWLDDRGAGAAALVLDDEIAVGLLLWPAAGRVTPLSYEEVTALRVLADHLGIAAGAEARLDRSRERELEVERGMGRAEQELAALREQVDRNAARRRASTAWLADRARVATYGPASQMALTLAEHLGSRGDSFAVVAPPGSDALGWAAMAHLASDRSDGTLLVIDGANREEHGLDAWLDPTRSALEHARGGTLVVLDAHALPADVQRAVGTARRGDAAIVAVLPQPVRELVDAGRIDAHFAALFEDRELVVPPLRERAEDLRALALHALARIGLRLRGEPLGLSLEAQQKVLEHTWPGNDVEFEAALLNAALRTEGAVVEARDMAVGIEISIEHAVPVGRSSLGERGLG